jgi:WD40 repeat protein
MMLCDHLSALCLVLAACLPPSLPPAATASSDCTVKIWSLSSIAQLQAAAHSVTRLTSRVDRQSLAAAATLAWCVLPHTSYVYTAQFQPTALVMHQHSTSSSSGGDSSRPTARAGANSPLLVFTGSFDASIKIWSVPSVAAPSNSPRLTPLLSVAPTLLTTIQAHRAAVNSYVGTPLLSAAWI